MRLVAFVLTPSVMLRGLIWLWTLTALSVNIRLRVYPHLDWAVGLVCAGVAMPFLLRLRYRWDWRWLAGAVMVVYAVPLTSFVSSRSLYDLAQTIKLTIILVVGLTFFASYPRYALVAYRALITLAVANFMLLTVGGRFSRTLAALATSDGRWGTLLNPPGTLGILGLAVIVYSLYRVRYRATRLRGIILLLVSITLVAYENSRTITFLTVIGVAFTVWVWWWEHRSWRQRVMTLLPLVGVGLAASWLLPSLLAPTRLGDLLYQVRTLGFVDGLVSSDPVRWTMLNGVVHAISERPLLGTGMGSTRVDTAVGAMEVHVAYLQLWADAGLLAFLGFVWLAFGWVLWLPRVLHYLRTCPGSETTALTYNAIFLLGAFDVSNLLHTFSTEWAQWLFYLLPAAFFWEAERLSRGEHDRAV